jgi:hypothetical protein
MSIIFKMLKYLKNYSNLIKGAVIIALVVVIVVQAISFNSHRSSYKEEVSVLQTELDSLRMKNGDLETQKEELGIIRDGLEANLDIVAQELLEKDALIQQLQDEIESLKKTNKALAEAKAGTLKADGNYDQATKVWNALKDLGLNDYVCAGIMGNIMAEVGGQTLDISRWPKYSQKTYYGICQWAGSRKQRLLNDFGTTLEDQIRFLSVELFEEIPKGSSFYNMQDEKEAALYFAKYYERCGSGSYSVRQSNATKALKYFTA